MQLVPGGPEIPESLLQEHEDGRVVFFCGAGISYPAGLPGFKSLVEKVYVHLHDEMVDNETEAFNRASYDATIDLLERRIPNGREAVRKALQNILTPNLRRKGSVETHRALLNLARSRDGATRIVTTNFDTIFESVLRRERTTVTCFAAPYLPVPKRRWDGLVHLHGVLPRSSDVSELNRLVLSSGDFGLAYLTERWAARFVSELFRNYVVCFVGYSINDPVLRYMMDALAADRMLGESTPPAYAFADHVPGREAEAAIAWSAKGVTPVLYSNSDCHAALHRTLIAWGEIYHDGVQGRERVVMQTALSRPSVTTQEDNFVGRMMWALSDPSGAPARVFADFEPAPSLEWLASISEPRFGRSDLPRIGVEASVRTEGEFQFSLVDRPAPYHLAPRMCLSSRERRSAQWDRAMFHLSRWLTRYLDDPELVHWLIRAGAVLDAQFARQIEDALENATRLQATASPDELLRIRQKSPFSLPSHPMRVIWRLLLAGRIRGHANAHGLYDWMGKLERDGLSSTLRFELRQLLTPQVEIRQSYWKGSDRADGPTPSQVSDLFEWEITLAADRVYSVLTSWVQTDAWEQVLPLISTDLEACLQEALDLQLELSGTALDDRSHLDLRSIEPHSQNQGFRDWTSLIELLRDSWLSIAKADAHRAEQMARNWWHRPNPTFKRLALYASTRALGISDREWLDWLFSENGYWLFAVSTKREVMRLLSTRGKGLSTANYRRLESAILNGPPAPRSTSSDTAYDPDFGAYKVWHRLAKLEAAGRMLSRRASKILKDAQRAHSEWSLPKNQSDEFSFWITMGWRGREIDDNEQARFTVPTSLGELAEWLAASEASQDWLIEERWEHLCRDLRGLSSSALSVLAQRGQWPIARWSNALHVWSNDRLAVPSWRRVSALMAIMPDGVLSKLGHEASWWLKASASEIPFSDERLLLLCTRILGMDHEDGVHTDEAVLRAINHPVGHVTELLINKWFSEHPKDGEGMPPTLKKVFSEICSVYSLSYRHGRVVLASRLIALYRVDPGWTEKHLLPLLSWEKDAAEARALWQGFLWSPRLYWPLLSVCKDELLVTAGHFAELGEHAEQFSAFLTFAALDPGGHIESSEFRSAFRRLPNAGLTRSARALEQALEGATAREEYWSSRIEPFWTRVWPKKRELASPELAEALAQICILTKDAFPSALETMKDWLQPIEHADSIVSSLHDSGLCSRFPRDAMRFLDLIIDQQPWAPRNLSRCVDQILKATPRLRSTPHYRRLSDYIEIHTS